MTIADKTSALRDCELFDGLPESLLERVAGLSITRRLRRGEVLYSEQDQAAGIFVVCEGELNGIRDNGAGKIQVLSIERPGAVLAAPAVFSSGRYYCSMIAECDSSVVCVHAQHMRRLCREHEDLLWNLANLLSKKLSEQAELIESLAFHSVDQRVCRQLLQLAEQQCRLVRDGCRIQLAITRSELASRVAATREAVSRALSHLEDSGLIQIHDTKEIVLLRTHDLRILAGEVSPQGNTLAPQSVQLNRRSLC